MKNLLTKVKEFFKSFTKPESTEQEIKFQVNNKEEDTQLDTEFKKVFALVVLVALASIFVPNTTSEDSKSYVTLPSPSVTYNTACTESQNIAITTSSITTTFVTTTPVTTVETTVATTEETTVETESAVIIEEPVHEEYVEQPPVVEEHHEPPVEEPVVSNEPEPSVEEIVETESVPEEPHEMTYLGNLKITGYVATGNPTASGVYPYVGGVAMSRGYGLPWGTTIYIEGLGYYTLNDTGCSYGTVDVFCSSISECYDLTSWHDVYIVN